MEVLAMFITLVSSFHYLIPHSVYGDSRRIEVLAWAVIGLGHSRTVVGYSDYEPVLRQTLIALPASAQIVFLTDRGFVHQALFQFVRQHPRCQLRVRAKSSTQVRLADRRVVSLGQLCPPKGHVRLYQNGFVFGDGFIGPVSGSFRRQR